MCMIFTLTGGSIGVDFIKARVLVNRFVEYPKGTHGLRVVCDRAEDYSGMGHGKFCHDITAMRKEFIHRLVTGKPQIQDVLDAWATHQVCLAAERSVREDSRRVEVDYTLPDELQ